MMHLTSTAQPEGKTTVVNLLDAAEHLAATVRDGDTIAVGGFGVCGAPQDLIEVIRDTGVKDLTIVSNNLAIDGFGVARLLENDQISKVKASYIGENKLFAQRFLEGAIDLEFVPQGTLAERMRAGGSGIAAFYTRTGVGTLIAEGKPTAIFDGETYLLETAIKADISLVRAHTADPHGNLRYRYTAMNFNPIVAMCGAITYAEVEQLVALGDLKPNDIHTPSVFVHHLMTTHSAPAIERIVNRLPEAS